MESAAWFIIFGIFVLLLAGVVLILGAESLLLFFFRRDSELKLQNAAPEVSRSLTATVQRLRLPARREGEIPNAFVFESLEPVVVFLRSAGGAGSILLSRGWLETCDQERLEELLRSAVGLSQSKGQVLGTAAAGLAFLLLFGVPQGAAVFLFGKTSGSRGARLGGFRREGVLRTLVIFPFLYTVDRIAAQWSPKKAGPRSGDLFLSFPKEPRLLLSVRHFRLS